MRKHGIFERSVQDLSQIPTPPVRPHSLLVLLVHSLHSVLRGTGNGSQLCITCPSFSPEDYIPLTLDATALIIADKLTNLDDVEMVYPLRRNSSVVGLLMALGARPRGPSRKNLAYLMSQVADNAVAPPRPLALLSPPKLLSLRLSLNFCLYVDIVQEHDDMPQFRTLYSQGYIPKLPQLLHGPTTKHKRPLAAANGRPPTNSDLLKFMILPELLEGEGDDDDVVVASTLGDCLRHTTTELSLAEP